MYDKTQIRSIENEVDKIIANTYSPRKLMRYRKQFQMKAKFNED